MANMATPYESSIDDVSSITVQQRSGQCAWCFLNWIFIFKKWSFQKGEGLKKLFILNVHVPPPPIKFTIFVHWLSTSVTGYTNLQHDSVYRIHFSFYFIFYALFVFVFIVISSLKKFACTPLPLRNHVIMRSCDFMHMSWNSFFSSSYFEFKLEWR